MGHKQVGRQEPSGRPFGQAADERGSERVGAWERRSDGTPVRVVAEPSAGRVWRVWVTDCGHVPGAPSAHCLVCDAGEIIRRVWAVPTGWAALPDDALLAITARSPMPH